MEMKMGTAVFGQSPVFNDYFAASFKHSSNAFING